MSSVEPSEGINATGVMPLGAEIQIHQFDASKSIQKGFHFHHS